MCVCIHVYIYIYIYTYTRGGQGRRNAFWREVGVSQGIGIASSSWSDRVVPSIIYVFKPSG